MKTSYLLILLVATATHAQQAVTEKELTTMLPAEHSTIVIQRDARFQIHQVPGSGMTSMSTIKIDTVTGKSWRLVSSSATPAGFAWMEIVNVNETQTEKPTDLPLQKSK